MKEDPDALTIWREGMDEMIKQIEPAQILLYGGALGYDYKGIKVQEYKNDVLDRWKGKVEDNGR